MLKNEFIDAKTYYTVYMYPWFVLVIIACTANLTDVLICDL